MARNSKNDANRIFKSVPREFDPRVIGTIRVGSLAFYRSHYDEAVADQGEGTGVVSMNSGQSVTLNAKLASALFGLEIMGEHVPRLGSMTLTPGEAGLTMEHDFERREVTLRGGGSTWDFTAMDAFVFCMTAPSKAYFDTFSGKRVIWSIDRSDVDKFAALVARELNQAYPAEACFPFLSVKGARMTNIKFEHGAVNYSPRNVALENTIEGRLASLLFTNATFVKPSGPPRYFEKEEEYRFQFRRVGQGGRMPRRLPEFVDIPFAPIEKFVKFW